MSAELYLRLPCICLLLLAGEYPCYEDWQQEPEPICSIFLPSALQSVSFILKCTLEMFCFDLELLGKAITSLVPLAGPCMVACFLLVS